MPRRSVLVLLTLLVAAAAAIVLRLFVGGVPTSEAGGSLFPTLMKIRGDRAVAGAVVGAALAVSGVMLQVLLRNPIASPDLLGVASGAGLGVMVAAYVAFIAGHGIAYFGAATAAAVAGAFAVLALIYSLSHRRGLLDPVTLVLVGVVVSIMCGAGIQIVQHQIADQGLAAGRLLLGAIHDDVDAGSLWMIAGVTLSAVITGALLGPAMDAMSLGDDEATSLGVSVRGVRATLFIFAGVLAAGSVVLAGAIGFVGLVGPHFGRMLLGPGHRMLVIGAALIGATLVALADSLVRVVELESGRLPLSVVMSVLGGPVFLWMLRRMRLE